VLGCGSETTIRLLEPAVTAEPSAEDAGRPAAPEPEPEADASQPDGALVLRYDFAGTGTLVEDLVGSDDAQLVGGAVLDGSGGITLDGTDDFIDLPNGVLSRLTSVTIAIWLRWRGGVCWQRIFDFGSNDRGEGDVGNGLTSLYLTPANCIDGSYFASIELPSQRHDVSAGERFPEDRLAQAVLRFDADTSRLAIFVDGARVGAGDAPFDLSEIDDVNAWLGRSQWIQDRYLAARYEELRIYDRALSDAEVAATFTRGPDAP
jgi:hypothetical protein